MSYFRSFPQPGLLQFARSESLTITGGTFEIQTRISFLELQLPSALDLAGWEFNPRFRLSLPGTQKIVGDGELNF